MLLSDATGPAGPSGAGESLSDLAAGGNLPSPATPATAEPPSPVGPPVPRALAELSPVDPGVAADGRMPAADATGASGPGLAQPGGPGAGAPSATGQQAAGAPLPPALAPAIATLATASGGMVEITLSPVELGTVQVQVIDEGDGLRVVLLAERAETADLLRRHGDQLRADLAASGLGQASLHFGQRDGAAPQGAPPGRAGDSSPGQPATVADRPAPPPRPPFSAGGALHLRL
jgi:hypothetical protein